MLDPEADILNNVLEFLDSLCLNLVHCPDIFG